MGNPICERQGHTANRIIIKTDTDELLIQCAVCDHISDDHDLAYDALGTYLMAKLGLLVPSPLPSQDRPGAN